MPRPEDIAWKFVVRLDGKRWRCPYCHKESSGSVTRVRSHFLKKPKGGITSCTKVPEHIRTLMELLHNHEVLNKEDVAWKFVDRLGDNKWRCHHCGEEFFGDLTGVKGHLLGLPNEGISICTQVPDHVRTLMRSLLDEVAEEESRGANGQFSMEPQSHDMPAQAEVGEEESRETNHQFSTEPQSRGVLPPAIFSPSQVFEYTEHSFTTREETDMANLTSDQQQGERQSHRSLTMPSLVQNSHATIQTCVLQQPSSHWQTGHDLDILQQSNESQQSCDAESDDLLRQQLSMDGFALLSLESNYPPQLFDQSIQGNRQQHLSASSSLPDGVAEEESRRANGQSSMEPQSRHMPTQLSPSFSPESLEFLRPLLPTPRRATNMANFTQQDVIGSNSDQQSQAERQLHQSSAMPLLVQSSHVQPALVSPQHQSVLRQSINHEMRDTLQNATIPLDNLDTTRQPDLRDSPPENLVESRDVIVNALEEMQMNEQHNPTVGSSLQNDLTLDVDHTNRLLDWSQPCAVEGVPLLSNTSPTNAVEHPDQLYPRCDEEDGNDTRLFPLPTPMDIDPSIASPHSSDSHDNLQVLEAATNAIAPSSSHDLNRGYSIMTAWSINAYDEEIRNLKRKVEELDDKEADVKEQMEIESSSSVRKKPRKTVEKWLEKTERARNNFQIIGQANGETLPPKEQVVTLTREVEELIEQSLPQTLLIEERDAKGVKFLERKLIGEVIHGKIEFIWAHLKKNRACKLGIYGMGGVGKTTIMKRVYNRLLEDATFDGVVFVTVSKDFSISKLQIDIMKALKFGVKEVEDEEKRAAMLAEHLERKKNCVLILDDVWEHPLLDLKEVGIPDSADGFKLVLTTRSFDVCCQMRCQEKIKIEPLSQEVAESLFLVELGSKRPPNLEIAKYIVKECAGLPIGVITMARSMLGATDEFEWRDALERMKESSIGLKDMENKVLMILKFSYDRLRDPDVQRCFLSCALYPEDKLIYKFEMVEFFIDQGLIDGLDTRKKQYDRGLTILNKLIKVCLLEDDGDRMKMHDLIRDMALHIMSTTSIVKAGKQLRKIPPEECWTDALDKVSLMNNDIMEFPLDMSPNCPKLSTLLLNGCLSMNVAIPDSFFKNLLGLKVLDLSGNDMIELPDSISDLVNLRALLIRGCQRLHCTPYLGKLTSLRKLDASDCLNLEVLEGLEKLVNLRYIDLTKTSIKGLPKGTLDRLLYLQCLKVSAVNEEDISELGKLETFECDSENADDFYKCVRVIKQSNNPRYYKLEASLVIARYLAKVSDDARFGSLGRSVDIWDWDHANVSVERECTGIFTLIPRDVKKIKMGECDNITNLSGMGSLEYLGYLEIARWENLRVLCGGQDEEVIDIPAPTLTPKLFPSLRVLQIGRCPKLKYLFGHGFKSNLPCLRAIYISRCKEMVGIIAAVTSPPPHPLPFFPNLEWISVDHCDKMKRVVESEWMPHFPNLRRIKVTYCEKMEEIVGGPPPYLPVEEISLRFLSVSNCNNMRKLFPYEWLLHLRNLRIIYVVSCKGMVEIISGAGQGQEGSMMTPVNNTPSSFQPLISLPKLEQLELHNLPQLNSICGVPISCDSMKDLIVYECPELKGIPLQLRLCEIEELPHIWVEDEEKWKTLMWDHSNAQAILQRYLRKGEHANNCFLLGSLGPPNAIELSAEGKDLPQLCS